MVMHSMRKSPERYSSTRLFVSPHSDDVAFSCGGYIASHLGPGNTLLTVFSRSCWNASEGRQPGSLQRITNIRREEDTEFALRVGFRRVALDLPDSSARGYSQKLEYDNAPYSDVMMAPLRRELSSALATAGPMAAVYVPLGVGHHIDHLLVRDMVTELCPSDILVYYEDLPHALRFAEAQIRKVAKDVSVLLKPMEIDISNTWKTKRELVLVYKSQIGPTTVRRIRMYASRVGRGGLAERFWLANSLLL